MIYNNYEVIYIKTINFSQKTQHVLIIWPLYNKVGIFGG